MKKLEEFQEHHSSSSGLFFKARRLFCEDSALQRIEVLENEAFGKILLLDGLVQTTEGDDYFYHEMLVHPALVAHPGPERVLIIGGGDGGALREVLRYPLRRAVLVEIDPRVIQISKAHFPWLTPALADDRSELVIDDGRAFVEKTEEKFDLVFVDSSDPIGPSLALHEKSFFESLKRRLNHDGIVTAQLGSPLYQRPSIARSVKFLKEIFRMVQVYMSPVPTYPGGVWCYGFLSDEIRALDIRREPFTALKYYNAEIHRASFALPNFLKDILP